MTYVVYRLLGEDFRLLYVGCTGNLEVRLSGHRSSQPWWSEVICYSVEHHGDDRRVALDAESLAIRTESPLYNRQQTPANSRPIAERFWEKAAIGTPVECWGWKASQSNGNGQFCVDENVPRTAQSVAYELTHGVRSTKRAPVWQTCGNRLCVNPAHLRLGRPRRTRCVNGHEYTEANTYVVPATGVRQCRKCVAANARAYQERRKTLART